MPRNLPYQEDAAYANTAQPGLITLSGTLTLTFATYNANMLIIDPGGAARTVVLWPEADAEGVTVTIKNMADAGTELLTVTDDTPTTVGYVQPGETAVFACDGTTWVKVTSSGVFGVPSASTATGNVTLTAASPRLQQIDPGGSARDVTLPALTALHAGDGFLIDNAADAAETITVKDSGGSTVASVPQNRAAWVVSTGAAWVAFPYSRNGS